jgi:hypothetical protein
MRTKRTITPHKGGRTERIAARITPADLERLNQILAKRGIGFADWLEKKIKQEV